MGLYHTFVNASDNFSAHTILRETFLNGHKTMSLLEGVDYGFVIQGPQTTQVDNFSTDSLFEG